MRNSVLAADPDLRRDYPALSQALLAGASGQIRNMATVGGNLLQRTRCGYFNDISKPCNKREPGTGCPARTGVHRDLAIIGHSESCIATHPSDMAVALSALDATVHVLGPDGPRVLALDDFYRLPGSTPKWDTTLRHGELITGVELPPPSALTRRSTYRKARDRASYAFAAGSVAAAVTVDDGTVTDVGISFGAIAHRPWRARIAEAALVGGPVDAATLGAALDLELDRAEPFPDNAFKVPLSRRLAVSALLGLIGGGALTATLGRSLGTPRVEGPDKVTGAATYAAEYHVDGICHGWIHGAQIAKGRVLAVDVDAALATPGVLAVFWHGNAPKLSKSLDPMTDVLQSDEVAFRGQVVALVVAETPEVARDVAMTLDVEYAPASHDVVLTENHPGLYTPKRVNGFEEGDSVVGEPDEALAAAPVLIDAHYTTPAEHNNPMEPHATVAQWSGRHPHRARQRPRAGSPCRPSWPRSS